MNIHTHTHTSVTAAINYYSPASRLGISLAWTAPSHIPHSSFSQTSSLSRPYSSVWEWSSMSQIFPSPNSGPRAWTLSHLPAAHLYTSCIFSIDLPGVFPSPAHSWASTLTHPFSRFLSLYTPSIYELSLNSVLALQGVKELQHGGGGLAGAREPWWLRVLLSGKLSRRHSQTYVYSVIYTRCISAPSSPIHCGICIRVTSTPITSRCSNSRQCLVKANPKPLLDL